MAADSASVEAPTLPSPASPALLCPQASGQAQPTSACPVFCSHRRVQESGAASSDGPLRAAWAQRPRPLPQTGLPSDCAVFASI